MNEQHAGVNNPNMASPGGNSPVVGRHGSSRDRFSPSNRFDAESDTWNRPRRDTGRGEAQHSGGSGMLTLGAGLILGVLAGSLIGPGSASNRDRGRHVGQRRSIAIDETLDLIASDKVEGTAVYDRSGERLGSVNNFMVGKRSGQVAYAVMSFGGWLGMAESYHPLPWDMLTYDTERGGYVVNLTKERLREAPTYEVGREGGSGTSYWREVKGYWG